MYANNIMSARQILLHWNQIKELSNGTITSLSSQIPSIHHLPVLQWACLLSSIVSSSFSPKHETENYDRVKTCEAKANSMKDTIQQTPLNISLQIT